MFSVLCVGAICVAVVCGVWVACSVGLLFGDDLGVSSVDFALLLLKCSGLLVVCLITMYYCWLLMLLGCLFICFVLVSLDFGCCVGVCYLLPVRRVWWRFCGSFCGL